MTPEGDYAVTDSGIALWEASEQCSYSDMLNEQCKKITT